MRGTRIMIFTEVTKNKIEGRFKALANDLKYMKTIEERLKNCEESVALGMKYLYTTMPYSDIGNYDFETILDFATHGVFLWTRGQFKENLPEDIFLNYVLHHRVNEEEISPCRSFFYHQLKDRIRGLSMKEAILEVNYWCCEEATYQTTDDRTMAAIDVYKRAYGRCGEESTYAVNALRSIGIPARQVYAPKWSHCDDNHAWVEVYCEGQWYFLGACEPEEILNKGWFTSAASRAMLIHSRWFDFEEAKEEQIEKEGMVTMLNQTSRYAKTKKIFLTVVDENKEPVEGALVDFQVLNYSELSTIAAMTTKKDGTAAITLGLGSIHIHGRKGQLSGEALIDTRVDTAFTIILTRESASQECWEEFDFIAPKDCPINKDKPSEKQRLQGKAKYTKATDKRLEKVKNIINEEENKFLKKKDINSIYREALLKIISKKDRDTFKAEILEEHFHYALSFKENFSQDIFIKYILNPRIKDEPLTRYREFILNYFSEEKVEEFKESPSKIWNWIEENIKSKEDKERTSIVTCPVGILKVGIGSSLSKNILFVAMARTFGIPARLNEVDGAMEFWKDGAFEGINREEEKSAVFIIKSEENKTVWKYKENWSLSFYQDSRFITIDLSKEEWDKDKLKIFVRPGRYKFITSNRLPNGNIFAKSIIANIGKSQVKEITLSLRLANLGDMLEAIELNEFSLKNFKGEAVLGSTLCKNKKRVFLWLEEGKEPTEHILNELIEKKEQVKGYLDSFIFIVKSKETLKDSTISKAIQSLKSVEVYYDDFQENVQTLGRRMFLDPDKLPLILVTGKGLTGIYGTSGYNVGTGDMLLRILMEDL